MPSTRTYHSILPSLNNASVAMPSLATALATRIPAPHCASVARVPIATARSIPRPINSLSVTRKYTPTVQRARPSTTVASMASSFAAMSISNPVNQVIASPSAPKPTSSLPCVAVPCSKLVSDRIQARRQRVIANLQAPKKRPTAPASISQSSSMPSRAVPPAVITPVSILKSPSNPSRVIPPPRVHAPASTLVSSWMPLPWCKPRGTEPYCEGRPRMEDRNGNRPPKDYGSHYFFGIKCKCTHHRGDIPTRHWTGPRLWKTTPAEANVDPTRPRIVRFADNLVQSTRTFRPWWNKVWPRAEQSSDYTTEAEDDAAIRAMDNQQPSSSDFESTWQALMDEGFPDDDEYF